MLIQKYTKKWIEDFDKIKKAIGEALANTDASIVHIGSTSVPNLDAKPIIDLDIIYDKTAFEEIQKRLGQIGYYHNGNQGIPDREAFRRKENQKHPILDFIIHHLYACPIDSEELKRHILFRNHLIANEDARIEYQNLKYKIAKETNQDKKKYAELKETAASDFINSIIEKVKSKEDGQ